MAPPGAYYDRPSPWVPAIILGVILLVSTTPYRVAPDVAMAYHPGVRRSGNFFPPALIWIPVIVFLLIQFFGGSQRSYGYGRGLGRWYSGSYGGGAGVYPGGDPYDINYIRYNGGPYADRPGVLASLMDYGGYWLLILLGIWLFSLVGPGAMSPRLGFPWSLFAPQPQVVMPML